MPTMRPTPRRSARLTSSTCPAARRATCSRRSRDSAVEARSGRPRPGRASPAARPGRWRSRTASSSSGGACCRGRCAGGAGSASSRRRGLPALRRAGRSRSRAHGAAGAARVGDPGDRRGDGSGRPGRGVAGTGARRVTLWRGRHRERFRAGEAVPLWRPLSLAGRQRRTTGAASRRPAPDRSTVSPRAGRVTGPTTVGSPTGPTGHAYPPPGGSGGGTAGPRGT